MSNIWADSFSAIREPFFEEKKEKKEKEEPGEKKHKEGPAEAKEVKKWWDDDGDGKGYEEGEVSGKFKKKKVKEGKEYDPMEDPDFDPHEAEKNRGVSGKNNPKGGKSLGKGYEKGEVEGKFKKKVKKEELELDEASVTDDRVRRNQKAFGSNYTPPRDWDQSANSGKGAVLNAKQKEKQRRKSLREEELELDENRAMARDPEGRKSGYSKQPDPSKAGFTGTGNMSIAQIAKMSARIKKEKETQKEERELSSKTDKNDKLDVRKGIHNKINTKPTVTEEVEAWVDELLAEGYDLSEFTWDEVSEIYESTQTEEGNTYGMPAKGDVERQKVDPLASAKAKAARSKVAKERADFQVAQQQQRLKVNANEAVLQFVSGRTELFEGVYDPKKSKMRSASERTKNAMTDAQRKAAKKESERTSEIHSKGETVLAGLRSSGKKGKIQTTAAPKAAAPAANRQVKGKYDKLAKAADNILKGLKDK
jgi:hypothetical protein